MSARSRFGGTYVVVLMSSLIVSSIALAAIETSRWYVRDINRESEFIECSFNADNAFEIALAKLNADLNWRTTHINGAFSSPITIGNASLRYRLTDSDGSLSDDDDDDCTILVSSSVGDYTQAWEATLRPNGDPLDCLSYSLVSNKVLSLGQYGLVGSDQSVGVNDSIQTHSNAHLTGNCFVTGSTSGNVYGTVTNLAADIAIPTATALDRYIDSATEIPITDLPLNGGQFEIKNALLSATNNTLNGSLNSQGVYYIDCQNNDIHIFNSRLACTLVLKDPGSNSFLYGSLHWQAEVTNYPILLVDGEIDIALSRSPLREADIGVNLNPTGTPYRGTTDTTTGTIYPSALRGLIYASDTLEFSNVYGETVIQGLVITNDQMTVNGDLLVQYRDIYFNDPPPGFTTSIGGVSIVSGSISPVPSP